MLVYKACRVEFQLTSIQHVTKSLLLLSVTQLLLRYYFRQLTSWVSAKKKKKKWSQPLRTGKHLPLRKASAMFWLCNWFHHEQNLQPCSSKKTMKTKFCGRIMPGQIKFGSVWLHYAKITYFHAWIVNFNEIINSIYIYFKWQNKNHFCFIRYL